MTVRAREGGRLSQLIQIKLLQAQAYGMSGQKGEEGKALTVLAEAVRLGEAEGFIRSFVDEGPLVATLLSQLRARERRARTPALDAGSLSFIDRLLAAFEGIAPNTRPSGHEPAPIQVSRQRAGLTIQHGDFLVEPLSPRELEVLGLLAQGASNAEI
jgi:LuxR family maltose regulon positive regulatory protein